MRFPNFFGTSYTLDSVNADCQSSINVYLEVDESKAGKNVGRMRGSPGLASFATLPSSNVLAVWAGEGRLLAVAGTAPAHLYEVFADGTYTDHLSVGNAVLLPGGSSEYAPAQIYPNGNQILVIHGGLVWVDNGAGAVAVTMTDANYTDLTIVTEVGQATLCITSPSSPFGSADVNQELVITGQEMGGTGTITPGTYIIGTVFPDGNALLTQSGVPTPAGTLGATLGIAAENFLTQMTAGTGTYLDTYGITAPPSSKDFYISAIDNFLSWQTLDEGAKEGYPDNILCLFSDHELLWIFGDLESTEIWQDTGNANFPFQRLTAGGLIHYGLAAQYSPVRLGFNGVAWLAWSAGRGSVQAVYAQGLLPQRVSTHAVEQVWRTYSTIQDAIGYSYIEDGHEFWCIHFPSGDATWLYDLTASTQLGIPVWHPRFYWDGTWATPPSSTSVGVPNLHRQLQRSHAYGFLYAHGGAGAVSSSHFVGDRSSGKIYIQSLTALSDNGQAIFRQRAGAHLSEENMRAFIGTLQLDAEVGNQDMTVYLDYSRDFGHSFINPFGITALAASNPLKPDVTGYNTRLRWRRLGAARDFVPRFTCYSIAKISWTDAFMEAGQGTG